SADLCGCPARGRADAGGLQHLEKERQLAAAAPHPPSAARGLPSVAVRDPRRTGPDPHPPTRLRLDPRRLPAVTGPAVAETAPSVVRVTPVGGLRRERSSELERAKRKSQEFED